MLDKILKEVVVITVGKQAEPIADLLNSKKHVNEFILAKKLDITINQTRNILYKLADYGLVSSTRKKDKKKGWYTYFWRIESVKALEFLKGHLLKRKEQFENQIKSRETKQFYVCENCNIEFNEENALLHDFTCNECGKLFSAKDNSKLLRELKRNSDKIDKELEIVEQELSKEQEKLEKEKEKELKKEKEEKKAKREKNKAAKKKVSKKKVVKKKVAKSKKKTSKKKTLKKKVVKKKVAKSKKKTSKKKTLKKKVVKKKAPKKKSKKKIAKKKTSKKTKKKKK